MNIHNNNINKMVSRLMELIDKNKLSLKDNDYLSMCNILIDIKKENDKMKKNLYKIKYIKQSVKAECMIKGFKLISKVKTENVIIEPHIISDMNEYENIEEYNCLLASGDDNNRTLKKVSDDDFSNYYTLDTDGDGEDIDMKYRKIILLSYSKV